MSENFCHICGLECAGGFENMPCKACFRSAWQVAYETNTADFEAPPEDVMSDADQSAAIMRVAAELDRRDALAAELEALDAEITGELEAIAPIWMCRDDAMSCVRAVARAERAARWRPQDEAVAPSGALGGDLEAPRDGEALEAFHARAASSLLDHYLAGDDPDVAAELREILDHVHARAIASMRAELADALRRQDAAVAATCSAVAELVHAQRPAALADALRCFIQALGGPLEVLEASSGDAG